MLLEFTNQVLHGWLGLDPASRWVGTLHFFIYDSLKIFLLLAGMIFAIGVLRTWLPESRLRRWMGAHGPWAYLVAALFGAITPFCSCSSLPIFISLLRAGVPLGVTFSFLITSPLINEYLVVLMAAEFGLPITIAYIVSGIAIGLGSGLLLGKLNLEHHLEADMAGTANSMARQEILTWRNRLGHGWRETVQVLRQIWIWVLVGVALGAFIHNYIPQEIIQKAMQATGPFSVPIAALLGVPMYGSCAAIVPVAVVLFEKGIPLGTALAFMMAMAALSLPEAVMLRRVMKLPLIAAFFGITTLAIILTGYLLNALAPFL
jgi:uncharacterized membrane protein YraQ (UPF0718 family)